MCGRRRRERRRGAPQSPRELRGSAEVREFETEFQSERERFGRSEDHVEGVGERCECGNEAVAHGLLYLLLQVTNEQCLQALEHSDWELSKAIKIAKLQKKVAGAELAVCSTALEATAWDVNKAAQWIVQQDDEVTQV